MSNNQLQANDKFKNFIVQNQKTIAKYETVISKGKTPAFLQSVAMTYHENKALQDALNTDIGLSSFLQVLKIGIRTGLSVAPREGKAAIIAYNTQKGVVIEYQIMKEGYIELALNTGAVEMIRGFAIHENDEFKPVYDIVNGDRFQYSPASTASGMIVGAFAEMLMKNGKVYAIHLTLDQLQERKMAALSGKKNPDGSYWNTHFSAACVKTAIKDLLRKTKIKELYSTNEAIDENWIPPSEPTPADIKGAAPEDITEALKEKEAPPKIAKPNKELFKD